MKKGKPHRRIVASSLLAAYSLQSVSAFAGGASGYKPPFVPKTKAEKAAYAEVIDTPTAVTELERSKDLTFRDFFPKTADHSVSRTVLPLDEHELDLFNKTFEKQVEAMRRIGVIHDSEQFKSCWDERKSDYLNRETIRNNLDRSLQDLLRIEAWQCRLAHPNPAGWRDQAENITSNKVLWGALGVGTGVLGTVGAELYGSVKNAVALSLIGDLVSAFTEPVKGPVREFVSVVGRRILGPHAVKIADSLARKIRESEKTTDKLEHVKQKLVETKKFYYDHISFPGLTTEQMESDSRTFDRMFVEAMQIWNTTLAPNSQAGRSIVLDGVVFRPKNFLGDLAMFHTKTETFRQGISADLPRLEARNQQQIDALTLRADDELRRVSLSDLSPADKLAETEKVKTARDTILQRLRSEREEISKTFEQMLFHDGMAFSANASVKQDSNIALQKLRRAFAKAELKVDASDEIVKQIIELRDRQLTSPAAEGIQTLDDLAEKLFVAAKRKAAEVKTDDPKADEKLAKEYRSAVGNLLKDEAESRRASQAAFLEHQKQAQDFRARLEHMSGEEGVIARMLERHEQMLYSQQQSIGIIAGQRLHDKMFPEYNKKLPPHVEEVFRVMQKQMAFTHFEDQVHNEVIKLMHEMGLELGPNGDVPKAEDIVQDMIEKVDQDIATEQKAIQKNRVAAIRDWFRARFKGNVQPEAEAALLDGLAPEADGVAKSAGPNRDCASDFGLIKSVLTKKGAKPSGKKKS